jgi:beta-xylosidase/AraC-like DNA-binding protein
LSTNQIIRIAVQNAENEERHLHQEVELIYVLNGSVMLELVGDEFLLTKDSIILINTGKEHAWKVGEECLLCRIYIDYPVFTKMLNRYFVSFWCNSLISQDREYDKLRTILNNLIREYCSLGGAESFRLLSCKYELLDCLTRNFVIQNQNQWSGQTDERMNQVVEYISSHYGETITLHDVSSRLYLSDSSFSRLFKKTMGVNFVEYVNNTRLHYAVENLLYSEKSITTISEECGFSNPSAFNKLFKKKYHAAPTAYKKQHKQRSSQVSGNEEKGSEQLTAFLGQFDQTETEDHEVSLTIQVGDSVITRFNGEGNQGINFGDAVDLLQARLREHLEEMQNELGFTRIRICNIFSESMYVSRQNGDNDLNFAHIDNILDYLTDHHLKPVIELTGKPKSSFVDPGENLFEDDNPSHKATSVKDWIGLVDAFIRHICNRYSEENLSEWLFEIGYDGIREIIECPPDYYEIWHETQKTIQSVNPVLKVSAGGFGSSEHNPELEQNLRKWRSSDCCPDVLSCYCYPYSDYSDFKDVYSNRVTDMDFAAVEIRNFRKLLEECHYSKSDITYYISEWNSSISDRNYYNDSCAKAAHIVQNLIDFAGSNVDLFYHNGSDFLSQYFDRKTPLMGASGLVSRDGIPKPVYFAFQFMNRLYSGILAKGENYIVTRNGRGSYFILLCNAKKFNHNYYLKKESEIGISDLSEIFENLDEEHIQISLPAEAGVQYRIKRQRLNEEQGNLLAEWKNLGYPEEFRKSEIEYLKKICRPRINCEDVITSDDSLILNDTLKAHEIRLIHVTKCENKLPQMGSYGLNNS